MAYTSPTASAADATFLGAATYTRLDAAAADASFLSYPQAVVSAASPLGAPAVLASNSISTLIAAPSMLGAAKILGEQVVGWSFAASPLGVPSVYGALSCAWATAPSMMGAPAALGSFPVVVIAAAASMLGSARALGYHDFTGLIGDAITHYVMDLTTPGGTVRVPISSWQATLQTGASNYVQCVVPAVLQWAASINDATHFTIYRTAQIPDGAAIEYEMARAPLQTASFARGPTNYTVTLSGYSTAFAEDEAPPTSYDRTLTGIRSVTIGSGRTRVRCAIDWLLRPAQRAYLPDGSSFIVGYVNYYQPQGNDSYMDAGE